MIKAGGMGEGEPWLLLAMFGHTYYPLLIVNLLIYSIKMIYEKKKSVPFDHLSCVSKRPLDDISGAVL